MRQNIIKAIIIQSSTGQIQIANIEFECSSYSKGERSLSSSRRSIKQVASSVWNTTIEIPLFRGLEFLDVLTQHLSVILIKNDWLKRSRLLLLNFSPSIEPSVQLINCNFIFIFVDAIPHALLNKFFKNGCIPTVSRNVKFFRLSWSFIPSSQNGFTNWMVHPDSLASELEDMVTSSSLELNFWLLFLVFNLKDLLPPVVASSFFYRASEITILLDYLFLLHISIDPLEGIVIHLNVDCTVQPLLNLVHD